MKKTLLIVFLIILAFIAGMLVFNKFDKKVLENVIIKNNESKTTNNHVKESDKEAIISPTTKQSTSKEDIEKKLKDLDEDVSNVDKSFSDTAVDVMGD